VNGYSLIGRRPVAGPVPEVHRFVGAIPDPGQRQVCVHCDCERDHWHHRIPSPRAAREESTR
jgi:hypothetical protein